MIPQISDLKQQNNSEVTKLQKQQQQKKEGIDKIFDYSTYALSIVISDKEQNQISLVVDSLSILLDNMQNQIVTSETERIFQKCSSLSLKKLYFRKMDRSKSFLGQEQSMRLFEQIKETQQLQMKQSLGNILLFDIQSKSPQFNECFQAACQINKNSNKKIIFINLSGLDHCDNTLSGLDHFDNTQKYQSESKLNYLYVNLKEFKQQKQSKYCCGQLYEKNFVNIYFNYGENQMFSWDQFKLIYRLHIKKLISKINSNLFILSIAKSLDSKSSQRYIRFDDDCLRRIIEKFCKMAQDKLFIYLILLDSEIEYPKELKYQTNDQEDMVKFLNCIQQGAIGNKIKSKVNFDFDTYNNQFSIKHIIWLQQFINIQIQVKLDPIFLKMYQRELRNLLLNNKSTKSEEFLQESTLMILNKKGIHKETQLYYQQNKVQFLFNSLLFIDYFNKLVVLLQQDEFQKHQYYLYYSEIQEDQYEIQCQRILLNDYIDDALLLDSHQKASLSVKNMRIQNHQQLIYQKMIYIHSLNNDVILEIQCFDNPDVKILERNKDLDMVDDQKLTKQKSIIRDQSKISDLVKNRRGPCVVQNSPISETDFMIIGGEFSNDPQICNIMEIVKLDQMTQSGFHSYILSKEVLFSNGSFVPWPYMLVLSSNQQPYQYIFLPGDYQNQINCYNKPIVNVYQYYAYQLTTLVDSFQFQWKKLNIIYDNSNLGSSQPFPIQYFSGNQSNILCMEDSKMTKWIIAKTINKQIQFGSKGKKEFFKCIEDLDSNVSFKDIEQMIITAEIFINENNLIIKEKFYYNGNQLILQQNIVDFNNEDLILF